MQLGTPLHLHARIARPIRHVIWHDPQPAIPTPMVTAGTRAKLNLAHGSSPSPAALDLPGAMSPGGGSEFHWNGPRRRLQPGPSTLAVGCRGPGAGISGFGAHGIVFGLFEARRDARCEVLRDFGRCRIVGAGPAAGNVVEGRYDGFEGGM